MIEGSCHEVFVYRDVSRSWLCLDGASDGGSGRQRFLVWRFRFWRFRKQQQDECWFSPGARCVRGRGSHRAVARRRRLYRLSAPRRRRWLSRAGSERRVRAIRSSRQHSPARASRRICLARIGVPEHLLPKCARGPSSRMGFVLELLRGGCCVRARGRASTPEHARPALVPRGPRVVLRLRRDGRDLLGATGVRPPASRLLPRGELPARDQPPQHREHRPSPERLPGHHSRIWRAAPVARFGPSAATLVHAALHRAATGRTDAVDVRDLLASPPVPLEVHR